MMRMMRMMLIGREQSHYHDGGDGSAQGFQDNTFHHCGFSLLSWWDKIMKFL